ncbi:hypothetical protein BG006_004565, partial [Podila minutissima]
DTLSQPFALAFHRISSLSSHDPVRTSALIHFSRGISSTSIWNADFSGMGQH